MRHGKWHLLVFKQMEPRYLDKKEGNERQRKKVKVRLRLVHVYTQWGHWGGFIPEFGYLIRQI